MLADLFAELSGAVLVDEDGREETLRLLPPATPEEVARVEAELPAPLPDEIRSALAVSKGFENGPLESLSLVDLGGALGMEDIFPHVWPIAHDGFGNYWVVDVRPGDEAWAPVFFACHDPPVIAFQSHTVEGFVRGAVALWQDGPRSPVDEVHEEGTFRIWAEGSGLVPRAEALASTDPRLRQVAEGLPEDAVLADLRDAGPGDGFPWGRFGPRVEWTRHGDDRLWSVVPPRRRSLLRRLFGGGGA